jgi:hypothetical protein
MGGFYTILDARILEYQTWREKIQNKPPLHGVERGGVVKSLVVYQSKNITTRQGSYQLRDGFLC